MPSSTASVGRLRLAPTTTEHFAEPILMHATIACTCTGASSIAASHGLPAWSSERYSHLAANDPSPAATGGGPPHSRRHAPSQKPSDASTAGPPCSLHSRCAASSPTQHCDHQLHLYQPALIVPVTPMPVCGRATRDLSRTVTSWQHRESDRDAPTPLVPPVTSGSATALDQPRHLRPQRNLPWQIRASARHGVALVPRPCGGIGSLSSPTISSSCT